MKLEKIDVTRDLIDISLDLHDDLAKESLQYTVNVLSWEPRQVQLRFNFNLPMLLSRNPKKDKLYLKFKQPDLFIDDETLEPFESFGIEEYTVLIPKQVPSGIDAQELKLEIEVAQNGFQAIIFISLVAQLVLKQSLKKIV